MTEAEKQYTEKMIADLQQSVCQWKERAEQAEALLEEIAKLADMELSEENPAKERAIYSDNPNRTTPINVKQIREEYLSGVPICDLSQKYGISRRSIMRYMAQA